MISDNDLIKEFTSLIFGYREPLSTLALDRKELEQVIKVTDVKVEGDDLIVLSIPSQLEMTITPYRVRFVDKSAEIPARSDFTEKVVQIVDILRRANNVVYSGFGLNFDVDIQPLGDRLAREVILDRFINSKSFASTGYNLVGASVEVWYIARERRHSLHIRPLGGNYSEIRYYCHLNAHFDITDALPDAKWLAQTIGEEYEDFKDVLSKSLVK
jgi:hypothetical protein